MADAPDAGDDRATAAPAEGEAAPEGAPDGERADKPEEPNRPRDFNRAFAALSRKEKAMRERDTAWQSEREKHASDLRELATFRQLRQQARQNPRAWLDAGAIDRDTAAQAFAEHRADAPREDGAARQLQAKLQQLEVQLAERDQKYQQMAAQQAKARYLDNIERHIDADPAAYELLKAEGRQAHVYELMDRHYREHNEVLPIKDACAALEAALEEQLTTQAQRYRGYKKLAPRLGWQAQTDDQPGDDAPPAAPAAAARNAPKQPRGRAGLAAATAAKGKPAKAVPVGDDADAEWAAKVRKYERG